MFILGHTPSFFVLLCLASFFGFSGTHLDSTLFLVLTQTLFRYSPGLFSGTRSDPFPVLARTLFRYSPGFYPFLGTRPDTISSPALCPDFLGFSSTRPDLIPFPLVYSGIMSRSLDLFQHCVRFPLVFSGIVSRFL